MPGADRPESASTAVRVSVVVATNRSGPYLAEALASVAAQSRPVDELVVVDDGSPDPGAVRAILEGGPAARLVRIEASGVCVARNRGVLETTGDLVVFLDDDDRWHPDRIREHLRAMAASPAAVASYCGMRTIDGAGDELVAADQRPAPDREAIVRGPGVMLPNLVLRRTVFDAVGGFDPAYRQGEDLDLVLKAAAHGPFAYVDATLVDYRYHATNTTRSFRALANSIRTILRRHRAEAVAARQGELVGAYDERLRANDRFAWWSAARSVRACLRAHRWTTAAGDVWWVLRFAPSTPLLVLRDRVAEVVSGARSGVAR